MLSFPSPRGVWTAVALFLRVSGMIRGRGCGISLIVMDNNRGIPIIRGYTVSASHSSVSADRAILPRNLNFQKAVSRHAAESVRDDVPAVERPGLA